MKVVIIAIFLLLTACSTRVVDFTIISTKNIDLDRIHEYERSSGRVEGVDSSHIIIFIPTGNPNAKEAVDRAIESVPGAVALLDGVLTHKWFYFPYIYGKFTYVVTGTALIDPKLLADNERVNSSHKVVIIGEDGNVSESNDLTKDEYESYIKYISSKKSQNI